jgi:hypothetical protein
MVSHSYRISASNFWKAQDHQAASLVPRNLDSNPPRRPAMLPKPNDAPAGAEDPLPIFPPPVKPPVTQTYFSPTERMNKYRIHRQSWTFLSNELPDGPASCNFADFRKPRFRRCPFDLDSIS